MHHVKRHPLLYAPVSAPVLFLLLAHLVSLPAHILLKATGLLAHQAFFDTMLTWSVYGFLPVVLGSYVSFHAVARPVAALIEQRQASLRESVPLLFLLPGAMYGAVIGCGLLVLLRPGSSSGELVLFLFCLLIGMLNWFLYCQMAGIKKGKDTV